MCGFCDKFWRILPDYTRDICVKQDKNYTCYVPFKELEDVSFVVSDNHAKEGKGSTQYHVYEWKFCPVCSKLLPAYDDALECEQEDY